MFSVSDNPFEFIQRIEKWYNFLFKQIRFITKEQEAATAILFVIMYVTVARGLYNHVGCIYK